MSEGDDRAEPGVQHAGGPSDGRSGGSDPSSRAELAALARADAALTLDLADLDRRDDPYAPLELELPPAYVARALADTDARANGPGNASFQVSVQSDGTVLVQGKLRAALTVPCARCLTDAVVEVDGDVVATFVPADRIRGLLEAAGVDDEDGVELESEDLDEFPYQGSAVDLRRLIDEQLGLAYPMRALCDRGESCAGLCSGCGADLNAHPLIDGKCAKCGHVVDEVAAGAEEEEEEPGWKAKLRLIKGD